MASVLTVKNKRVDERNTGNSVAGKGSEKILLNGKFDILYEKRKDKRKVGYKMSKNVQE